MTLRLISHDRTYYDGEPFVGLPIGELGDHGAAVRVESLAFTDGFLDELFDELDPRTVGRRPAYLDPSGTTAPGHGVSRRLRRAHARAGRLCPLRRRRRAGIARRVLRQHRPPPARRARSDPDRPWHVGGRPRPVGVGQPDHVRRARLPPARIDRRSRVWPCTPRTTCEPCRHARSPTSTATRPP